MKKQRKLTLLQIKAKADAKREELGKHAAKVSIELDRIMVKQLEELKRLCGCI